MKEWTVLMTVYTFSSRFNNVHEQIMICLMIFFYKCQMPIGHDMTQENDNRYSFRPMAFKINLR